MLLLLFSVNTAAVCQCGLLVQLHSTTLSSIHPSLAGLQKCYFGGVLKVPFPEIKA